VDSTDAALATQTIGVAGSPIGRLGCAGRVRSRQVSRAMYLADSRLLV
jgi:hypothetical protein